MTEASQQLISMIQECASQLLDFAELWKKVIKRGKEEGFKEKELQEMMRPYLKQKLNSKKIYYLFNREQHIARVRRLREKFTTNDDKNSLEDSSSFDEDQEIIDFPEVDNVDNVPVSSLDKPIAKVRSAGYLNANIDTHLVFDDSTLREALLARADGKKRFFLENTNPFNIMLEAKRKGIDKVLLIYYELEE